MSDQKINRTEQLNLRLHGDTVDRLEKGADRYGFRGKNSVAQDIIENYLDLWEDIQEAKKNAIESQRKLALGSFKHLDIAESSQGFRNIQPAPAEQQLQVLSEEINAPKQRKKRG